MNNKSRRDITSDQRKEIVLKSYVPGCIISEVAQFYGISKKTLYGWRSRSKKARRDEGLVNNSGNKFVELSIEKTPSQATKYMILKKAELTFSDFSLSIEGSVSSQGNLKVTTKSRV